MPLPKDENKESSTSTPMKIKEETDGKKETGMKRKYKSI